MNDRVVNAAKSFLSIYSKYSDPEIEKLAKAPSEAIKTFIEKFLHDEYKTSDPLLQADLDFAFARKHRSQLFGLLALSAIDRNRPRIAVSISCLSAKSFIDGVPIDPQLVFSLFSWTSAYLQDAGNSKKFKRSAKHFIQPGLSDNNDVDAISLLLLADAYEKRYKYKKALDTLEKVIELVKGRSKYLKFCALYSSAPLCGFLRDASKAKQHTQELRDMAYSTHSKLLRLKAQLRIGQNILIENPDAAASFFMRVEKTAKLIDDLLNAGKANWNLYKMSKHNPAHIIAALKCFNEGRYFDQIAKVLSILSGHFIAFQRYDVIDGLVNSSLLYLMREYNVQIKYSLKVQASFKNCKRSIKNEKELYEAVKEIIEILGKEPIQPVVTPAKEKTPEKAPEKEEKKEEGEKETAPASLTARDIKKLVEMARDRKPHWKTNLFKALSPFLGDDVANRILDTMAQKEPNEAAKLLENYFNNFFKKRK